MATMMAPAVPATTRTHHRTALVASADSSFRQRVGTVLGGLRWRVREVQGGAQAWGEAMDALPQAIIVDSWLPDLDVDEFLQDFRSAFPNVDVIRNGAASSSESAPGPFRREILYALRHAQEDSAAWNSAPLLDDDGPHSSKLSASCAPMICEVPSEKTEPEREIEPAQAREFSKRFDRRSAPPPALCERIPELIGNSPCMLDISRRIRRVAARTTPVLIEGPTGSGKEVVAEALHRLSSRNRKPFVAINCAAIPETLLEAELFGHTRGAFTGAVHGRTGRIEAADGGTLFLDEIGEMPLALQAKLLRFVEVGELQRVGDNATVKVDVRILAATHQPLSQQTQSGKFRADLYYRLAVFLIRTPALGDHLQDLPLLVDHFLEKMGRNESAKRIDQEGMAMLRAHSWPGNVRELEHVLERAAILAGDAPVLTGADIEFGSSIG
jgi:DNA-binding NtrC family response regulator